MLFPISAHYFCQLRPKPWREKNECWIIFFQQHGEKKGLMFLLLWKMTIFPIFLCLLCVGEWWPTHSELPESLCLSAFILFICENKKIESAFYEKVMTNCKQYCWKFHFIKTIYFQGIRKLFVLGYFLIKLKIIVIFRNFIS